VKRSETRGGLSIVPGFRFAPSGLRGVLIARVRVGFRASMYRCILLVVRESGVRRIATGTIICLLLWGCASQPPLATPTGKPEATYGSASASAVKSAIVSGMINKGFRITRDSAYELSFDKPTENIAAQLLLGSRYDSQPNTRATFTIAEVGPDVRVVADLAIITNPGSGFERRTDVTQGASAIDVQQFLDSLQMAVPRTATAAAARPERRARPTPTPTAR